MICMYPFVSFYKLSIKSKLLIFFTLSTCVMFYGTSEFIDRTLHSSLSKEENDFIYSRLHTIRAIIKNKPDYLEIIKKDIEWEGEYALFPEYYLRIMDNTGQILLETPGMSQTVPPQWATNQNTGEKHHIKDNIRRAQNDRFFLLKADSVETAHDSGEKLSIQIALDVTSEVKLDATNHKRINVLLFLGIIVTSLVGVVVTRKALRPLEEIAKVSELITVEKMAERTDPEKWPTELKRLAIAFNGMLDRLEESFSRLSQLASDMAHEIRTPLNNILGEAEIALARERSPAEYQNVLESGVEECQRLSRIIDGLLFMAGAENPATRVERSIFDPLEQIKEVCIFYEAIAEEHGATISCHGEGALFGEPIMFQRVISNLLANALHYSPYGVTIDIAVSQPEEQLLEVTISDTGNGIEEKDLAHIFDRFYRGDSSRSNYSQGSGLGLSIVKSIMELHGGKIKVDSRFGHGTTVTLQFPVFTLGSGQNGQKSNGSIAAWKKDR